MKKLIRLTEQDLHRIVKESVDKILSEAINELDPRTYASYAQKRRQQATNTNNFSDTVKYSTKADAGEDAARNAWNDKYGENDTLSNGYNKTEMINTTQNPYQVHHQSFTQNNPWDKPRHVVNDKARGFEANKIAQQMQQGNGQYIKGKGWQ